MLPPSSVAWPVELHGLDVNDERARLPYLHAVLDDAERAHAGRFRFERDAVRYIIRRGVLRELLADRLKCTPNAVPIRRNAFGKPLLAGAALHFNCSHTRDHALFAFSPAPVGCDIEFCDHQASLHDVIETYLCDDEKQALASAPAGSIELLYRVWVLKEACVKALGMGLSRDLKTVDISRPLLAEGNVGETPDGWLCRTFEPAPGFVAAVALSKRSVLLHCRLRAATAPRSASTVEILESEEDILLPLTM